MTEDWNNEGTRQWINKTMSPEAKKKRRQKEIAMVAIVGLTLPFLALLTAIVLSYMSD